MLIIVYMTLYCAYTVLLLSKCETDTFRVILYSEHILLTIVNGCLVKLIVLYSS